MALPIDFECLLITDIRLTYNLIVDQVKNASYQHHLHNH
jgi:hypothetical protein